MTDLVRRIERFFRRDPAGSLRRASLPEPPHLSLTIIAEEDPDDGGYVSHIVEVPGVWSQGDTEVESVQNAVDALTCVLQAAAFETQAAAFETQRQSYLQLAREDIEEDGPHKYHLSSA